MPLVRATGALQPAPREDTELPLEQLRSSDADERRRAARALSRDPGAVAALAARLAIETESSVRDSLFNSLVQIGGPRAADAIGPFLNSGDAGIRGGAIEALKRLGEDAIATLDGLLNDPDPDTRLLAVEVTRAWSSALAVPRLQQIMDTENHVNVCAAAVEVATELGTEALLAPLAALRARFAGDQFLIFGIDIARSRIQAATLRGA